MKFRKSPAAWRDAWNLLKGTTRHNPKPFQLRASSLPICPRAHYLDHVFGPIGEEFSFVREVSLERGHAVHSNIQKWLGRAGILFGRWCCPLKPFKQCDYRTRPKLQRPGKLQYCKRHPHLELIYEEFEVDYEGITGHPDALLTFTKKPPYILGEFKTASRSGYSDFPGFYKLKEPYWKHTQQANFYATVLSKYGIEGTVYPIKEVWIWYIQSGHLNWQPRVWAFKHNPREIGVHVKSARRVRRAIERDKLPHRVDFCKRNRDPWCSLAPLCFSPQLEQLLKEEHAKRRTRKSKKSD